MSVMQMLNLDDGSYSDLDRVSGEGQTGKISIIFSARFCKVLVKHWIC